MRRASRSTSSPGARTRCPPSIWSCPARCRSSSRASTAPRRRSVTWGSASAGRAPGAGRSSCAAARWWCGATRASRPTFPPLDVGAEHVGPWGWALRRERERFVLDTGDGVLGASSPRPTRRARRWKLIEMRDRNDNRIELTYDDDGHLVEVARQRGPHRGRRVDARRAHRVAPRLQRARPGPVDRRRALQLRRARATSRRRRRRRGVRRALRLRRRAPAHAARPIARASPSPSSTTARAAASRRGASTREASTPASPRTCPRSSRTARGRGASYHVRFDYRPGGYTEVADSTQVRRYFGNAHGLVEKRVDGVGVEDTTYDERGLVLARMDGEGAVTRYERDARGRVVRVTDPLGRVTTLRARRARARGRGSSTRPAACTSSSATSAAT